MHLRLEYEGLDRARHNDAPYARRLRNYTRGPDCDLHQPDPWEKPREISSGSASVNSLVGKKDRTLVSQTMRTANITLKSSEVGQNLFKATLKCATVWVLFAPRLVMLATVSAFIAVNSWWVMQGITGGTLTIDEAGYLGFAYNMYFNFRTGGIHAWWSAFNATGPHSPLTSAVTSFFFVVFGASTHVALMVTVLFGALVVYLSYRCGTLLGNAWGGALCAIVVATLPSLSGFSRTFIFAAPAAAVMMTSFYALIRSSNLTKLPFVLLFGISIGLLPLTRTMTISFIPGLLVAAVVKIWRSDTRRIGMRNLLLGIIFASFIAWTWLGSSYKLVYDYLTDFGYGKNSVSYGENRQIWNPHSWMIIHNDFASDFQLFHYLIILAGVIIGLVTLVKAFRNLNFDEAFAKILNSNYLQLFIPVLAGYLALNSSRNSGVGFTLPLLPGVAIMAVLLIMRFLKQTTSGKRNLTISSIVFVALLAIIPNVFSNSNIARPRSISILGFKIPVTDGRSWDQVYLSNGYPDMPFPMNLSAKEESEWRQINLDAVTLFDQLRGSSQGKILFGFRNYLFNVNTIQLKKLITSGSAMPVDQIDPAKIGPSVNDYRNWLTTGSASTGCVLLTSPGSIGEFAPPLVDTDNLVQAAIETGFTYHSEWLLPDGRTVTAWLRVTSCQ